MRQGGAQMQKAVRDAKALRTAFAVAKGNRFTHADGGR